MAKKTGSRSAARSRRVSRKPDRETVSAKEAFLISPRVARQALTACYRWKRGSHEPLRRRLRIYTHDPSLSDREGGVASVEVPWEPLDAGPKGSLFEIDGAGAPAPLTDPGALSLDDPHFLTSDGVAPSPADARFHLQMAYAVCSLTYAAFRRALGRDIGWAVDPDAAGRIRLRVRPFAFEGKNARYSRKSGELSFGYFRAGKQPAGFTIPGGLVFTALSHDVIAHETTHALLDGLRASFQQPTNVDVPAFHEGFADLVALFLHFTHPGVVQRSLRASRGVVERGSVLAEIAREFGRAMTRGARGRPLRSGIDTAGIHAFDSDAEPGSDAGPRRYDPALPPHELGKVLVSAVFEAFVTIVRRKTAPLLRIGGVDPAAFGTVPLDDALLDAVAKETCDVASQFLGMCIRAIDYCPPVDLLFGEYLRALVTADMEMEPVDKWGYREALMRSFRRRWIFPGDVEFMTEDAVRWRATERPLTIPGLAFRHLRFDGEPGRPAGVGELERQARILGAFVTDPAHVRDFGLVDPSAPPPKGVVYVSPPCVESIRVCRRAAPDGRVLFDTVAEVTQSCIAKHRRVLMEVVGGCTIVINQDGEVRYAITKSAISPQRLDRQADVIRHALPSLWNLRGQGPTARFVARDDMLLRIHGSRRE